MPTIGDILVVDDDMELVAFVVDALQEAGYLGWAAYDGASALWAIETAHPVLILLDIHMPGLSGLDVMEQLRRYKLAHVPIVLMTGDAAATSQFPTTHFPEYLLKPFDLDVLLDCVARYVD